MRTSSLIDVLARHAGEAPRHVAARRLVPVMIAGVGASAVLATTVLRIVSGDVMANTGWQMKLAYTVLLAGAAAWLAARLGRPAAATRGPWCALLAVVGVVAALGFVQVLSPPGDGAWAWWLGHSSRTCPFTIFVLSLPALAAVFWALRGLAPTRSRLAGAVAGVLAGALGATGYAFVCNEVSMSFVATWYTLGVAFVAALGAWIGPRVLRW